MLRLSAMVFVVCSAALFSAAATGGGTQIYKWTDSQGVVHYSDKAPTKAPQAVTLISLPEFPPVDPKAEAEEQAYIASVNQWYQSVLQQQSQLQYEQFLAWEQSQPAETPAPPVEQVSYVTPCWFCGFGFRHRHHHEPDADDFMHPFPVHPPMPNSFQTNIWSTRPNPFTQSLYKP